MVNLKGSLPEYFWSTQGVDLFLFCPLSRKESTFFLCEPCVSSGAGGNICSDIPPKRAKTIPLQWNGLKDQLIHPCPINKILGHAMRFCICKLPGRMFHEVGRGRIKDAAFTAINSQFTAPYGINDHTTGIGRILH